MEYKKEAVKLYLEQIKVLTALASALFISPGFILIMLNNNSEAKLAAEFKLLASIIVLICSVLFLATIVLTYFIYSSLVGRINMGEYNIERELTMKFSRWQFYLLVTGCLFYLFFIVILIFS